MRRPWILLIAAIVIIFDFITKHLIRLYKPNLELLPFLSLSYITNTGGAFGMLRGFNWFFIVITLIVVGAFIYYYSRIPKRSAYFISAALILAGALGNLIDRVFFGFVTDFIALSFWPAFNIADSALFIGAIILTITLFIDEKKK